jgi:tetratricopeptide (TPR) repeat protein
MNMRLYPSYIVIGALILMAAFPAHADKKETDLNKARKILVGARRAAEGIKDEREVVNTPAPYFSTPVTDKIKLFNAIAIAQNVAGDSVEARITIHKALQITKAIHDDLVRIDNIDQVSRTQALAGDVPGALQTVDLILAKSNKDDHQKGRAVYPFIHIAEVQITSGDQAGAKGTLAKAYEVDKLSKGDFWHVSVAQARIGDIEGARRTAEFVPENIKYSTFSEIAAAMIAEGETGKALSICEMYKQKYDEISFCLWRVGAAQIKRGERAKAKQTLTRAFQAANKEPVDSISRNVFVLGLIIQAQVEAGGIPEAFQNASALKTDLEKSDVLALIARTLAESGDSTAANSAIQQAILIIENSKEKYGSVPIPTGDGNDKWKKQRLGRIASTQAEIGDVKGALQTFEMIRDDPEELFWLWGIAQAQAKAGDIDGAFHTYKIYKTAHDHSLDYLILMDIAAAQAKAGDMATTKKTYQLARQAIGVTEESQLTFPLRKVPGIRAIYSFINKQHCCNGFALREIARSQARAGDPDGAFNWATKQISSEMKASALLGVAEGILDSLGVKYPEPIQLYDRGIT